MASSARSCSRTDTRGSKSTSRDLQLVASSRRPVRPSALESERRDPARLRSRDRHLCRTGGRGDARVRARAHVVRAVTAASQEVVTRAGPAAGAVGIGGRRDHVVRADGGASPSRRSRLVERVLPGDAWTVGWAPSSLALLVATKNSCGRLDLRALAIAHCQSPSRPVGRRCGDLRGDRPLIGSVMALTTHPAVMLVEPAPTCGGSRHVVLVTASSSAAVNGCRRRERSPTSW